MAQLRTQFVLTCTTCPRSGEFGSCPCCCLCHTWCRVFPLTQGFLHVFRHLHVHFNAITCPRMGGSLYAGKAILFDDVIDNITMDGEYYAKCSLTFTVGETEELYKKLDEGGAVA